MRVSLSGVRQNLMKQIHKDYQRPFLLEKTKLDRLMAIIHDRVQEHPNTTTRDDFEVFMSGPRRDEVTSIEDVLKLDNSRQSRIQRILVTCSASTKSTARPEHEIQVDFDGTSVAKTKITVSVRSDNAGWSDRALSEVEEQVERTSFQDRPARTVLALLSIGVLFVLLFMALSPLSSVHSFRSADVMWLRDRDVDRIEQILKQDRTITDDEMREVATRQLRNVLEGSTVSLVGGWTKQKIFVAVPLLAVLACLLYLMFKGYPSAIFLWGDEVARYERMVHTRRVIWNFLIGGIIFSVLARLLFAGLFSGT
jgi:hypothetical protein